MANLNFNKGVRMGELNFGWALDQLKDGKKVYREGWNGKGQYLQIVKQEDHNKLPYIEMKTVQDQYVPWVASQTDMLADDWCIYGQ